MKNKLKERKGITLIALVITIIVLLILAMVSIKIATGDGLINKAQEAKTKTEYASAKEKVQLAVLGSYDNNGDLSLDKLKEEVKSEGGSVTGDTFPVTVKMDGHDFTIDANGVISDKGNGGENTPSGEKISKSESYVGYYADFEGDGTIDGIIYADLAVGGSGTWNSGIWNSYSYSAETGLKDYYISKTGYEGKFGTKDVLTSTGTGKDRFYVMALEDFNPGTSYCWYDAAYGKLDNLVGGSTNDFGQGKTNTTTMIAEWNKGENGKYGAQDDNGTYKDMWGVIQKADSAGKTWNLSKWFVPSKAEWAAFGDFLYTKLGVTTGNYGNYGLKNHYWSSAQSGTGYAYTPLFSTGNMNHGKVDKTFTYDITYYVRLSATF